MQHCAFFGVVVTAAAPVCSVLLEYGLLVVYYVAHEAEGCFFNADCSARGEFLYLTCKHWRILVLGKRIEGITRLFGRNRVTRCTDESFLRSEQSGGDVTDC